MIFSAPEHNLPEAAENCVKTFMDTVTIQLSPEAEAQKAAAEKISQITDTSDSAT